MNKLRLKAVENDFLTQFPLGFADPEMVKIAKKHSSSWTHSPEQKSKYVTIKF